MWKDTIQNVYESLEELQQYNEIYGVAQRLGFDSVEELWEKNPMVQGSTDPKDYKLASNNDLVGEIIEVDYFDSQTMKNKTGWGIVEKVREDGLVSVRLGEGNRKLINVPIENIILREEFDEEGQLITSKNKFKLE